MVLCRSGSRRSNSSASPPLGLHKIHNTNANLSLGIWCKVVIEVFWVLILKHRPIKPQQKPNVWTRFCRFMSSVKTLCWFLNFSLTGAPSSTAPPPCMLIWSTNRMWLNMTCHPFIQVIQRSNHFNDLMPFFSASPGLEVISQVARSSVLFLCCRHHGRFSLSSRSCQAGHLRNGHQGNHSEWILQIYKPTDQKLCFSFTEWFKGAIQVPHTRERQMLREKADRFRAGTSVVPDLSA